MEFAPLYLASRSTDTRRMRQTPHGGNHDWLGLDVSCNRADCSSARLHDDRWRILRNREVPCSSVPHSVLSVPSTGADSGTQDSELTPPQFISSVWSARERLVSSGR